MPTNPGTRKRWPTERVAGGIRSILYGVFGAGQPTARTSSPSQIGGDTRQEGGYYHMHEGDIFEPGTGNWVFDPFQETPIQPIWGHAFLANPNFMHPTQPPQIYSDPTVKPTGIGGLVAGQFAFPVLIDQAPEQGA